MPLATVPPIASQTQSPYLNRPIEEVIARFNGTSIIRFDVIDVAVFEGAASE